MSNIDSSSIMKGQQRRRAVLTCVECRKRKQKCNRGHPCMQCVARGPESICTYRYDNLKGSPVAIVGGASLSNTSSTNEKLSTKDPNAPLLLQHAHDYGYSNSDSLNSMGILTKVVTDIMGKDISVAHPAVASKIHSRVRSEYYGYVRRLPPKTLCELLFEQFFTIANPLNSALDETIFREQLERWWSIAPDTLLKQGPENLPLELQSFPGLIFQVLAIILYLLPEHNSKLDDLKFGPSQTFAELSKEYTDCGVELAKLLPKAKSTLVGVQQSFLRDNWLIHSGDLMQAWNHSGETVRDAMAMGLHLEPEIPSSSQPEALLDALWMNELRKRTWLNLFVWDSAMALALGRPIFIDQKKCTVSAPIDCNIPRDRLKRVPVARSNSDKPTPLTERILRYTLSRRFFEIRELETQGPLPRNPEKVKELHHFAVNFQKSLPAMWRTTNTDKQWDQECPYMPTHRELLSYLIDSFLMTLHRPYIFTREKCQHQVYKSALAILDSQDRLFESMRNQGSQYYISSTFPTFDAAVLLAVVLVSNPERYHTSFARPYQSLKNALNRLKLIGSLLPLAKTGTDILQTTISRVVEAQERAGFPIQALTPTTSELSQASTRSTSTSLSPEADTWQFDFELSQLNQSSIMDWAGQNPEFDFSNLEVPMPLKELLMDEEMAGFSSLDGLDGFDPAMWMAMQQHQDGNVDYTQTGYEPQEVGMGVLDVSENSLWNFLTGYETVGGEERYDVEE